MSIWCFKNRCQTYEWRLLVHLLDVNLAVQFSSWDSIVTGRGRKNVRWVPLLATTLVSTS